MAYSAEAKQRAWDYLNSLQYIACRDQFYLPTTPKLWVIEHEMVAPERDDMAESLGRYFQNPSNPASTHFGVDSNSAVRYAQYYYQVYGTDQQGNIKGWHVEHAGMGAQSPEDWQDTYSQSMLKGPSCKLTAALCVIDDIPVRHVAPVELRQGVKGLTSHYEMCQAFMQGNERNWHYDPKNFPWDQFVKLVQQQVDLFAQTEEIDMAAREDILKAIGDLATAVANLEKNQATWEQDTRKVVTTFVREELGKHLGTDYKSRSIQNNHFNGTAACVQKLDADTDQPLPPTKVMGG